MSDTGTRQSQQKQKPAKAPLRTPAQPASSADVAPAVTAAQAPGMLAGLAGQPGAGRLRRASVARLQRTTGNGHVQRMLARQKKAEGTPEEAVEPERQPGGETQTWLAGAATPPADDGDGEQRNGTPLAAHNGHTPAQVNGAGAGLLQRQAETEAAGEEGPSAAEKAAALAAARAAEQAANQARSEGQTEIAASRAEKEREATAKQVAHEKAAAEKAAQPEPGAPAAGRAGSAAPSANGSGRQAQAGGAAPEAGAAAGGGGAAPADRAPATPAEDPGFQAVAGKVKAVAGREQAHAPAEARAAEAQAAAEMPAAETEARAQSTQVDEMEQAETPAFDAAGFKARLMERIAALAPDNAEDADEFKEEGRLDTVQDEMQGQVAAEQEQSQAPMAEATEQAPDTGAVDPKPVRPLDRSRPGPPPPSVDAARAAPKPKTTAEVEAPLQADSQNLDQQMAENEITTEQLERSNEPEFQSAVTAKEEAQTHAETAPVSVRQTEQETINQAQAQATNTAEAETQAMHEQRAALLGQVDTQQEESKAEDEQARAEVGARIQAIYEETRTNVEAILDGLDQEVDELFAPGAEAAKQAFEDYVDARMEAYKERRYGGWLGWARWIDDKVTGMPAEVNAFYQQGRQLFIQKMDAVVDSVVALIGRRLTEAKAEIANGKKRIQEYVHSLPQELQAVGQEAAQDIQSQFDQLEQNVDDKQNELIDSLAQQYQEHVQAVDARIEEMKAANRGLVDRALDAIGGVIQTILELKAMLTDVLARAAAAIGKIIKDPIGFLGNLIDGIKLGLNNFIGNIGTHLQQGFIGWLTGAITEAGITLPESFDLQGIFMLVMQILGLTFDRLRARVADLLGFDPFGIYDQIMGLVAIYQEEGLMGLARRGLARVIGQERMEALMQALPLFEMLMSGDFGGLWALLQEHLSTLKEMVFGKIQEFLIERVIKAGITWVLGLLNPAGAFIKACKLIYDVIMFFVERGRQIMALVNAVINSVTSIAEGNLSVAAEAVEQALARAVPVAIGFLASLLGLGGVSEKVREVVESVRSMVDRALTAVFNSRPVQMVAGFIRRVVGRVRGLVTAGVDRVRGMARAGVERARGALGGGQAPASEREEPAEGTVSNMNVELPFSMAGAGHHLYIHSDGPELVVEMASRRRDTLETLVNRAINEESDGANRSQVIDYLLQARHRLEELKEIWQAGEYYRREEGEEGGPREDGRTVVHREAEVITTFLVSLGRDYNIPDLANLGHASQYVEGDQLKDSSNIRRRFYKSNYRSVPWTTVVNRARTDQKNGAGQTLYECQNEGPVFGPNHKPLLTQSEITMEHVKDVSIHWNEEGHNMTQEERYDWYDNPDNLRVYCQSCNSAQPKEHFQPNVGPDFRGPGDLD